MPEFADIVAVASPRKGSGKTSVAIGIAHLAASRGGRKTLLLDLDPQCGATLALLPPTEWAVAVEDKGTSAAWLHAWVLGEPAFNLLGSGLPRPRGERFTLLPGSFTLEAWAGRIYQGLVTRRYQDPPHAFLEECLEIASASFDLIVVDVGAGFSALPQIAMNIATDVVITLSADPLFAADLHRTRQEIRRRRKAGSYLAGGDDFHYVWHRQAGPSVGGRPDFPVHPWLPTVDTSNEPPWKNPSWLDALAAVYDPDTGF